MFFESSIRALRESRMNAAVWETKARIGEREWPIVGGIFSRFGLWGNGLYRPFKVVGAFFLGNELTPTPPMPELPSGIQNTSLAEDLTKAFDARVHEVDNKYRSMHALFRLDISGYQQAQAVARHDAARQPILLPEERQPQNSVPIVNLGNLTPSMTNISRGVNTVAASA